MNKHIIFLLAFQITILISIAQEKGFKPIENAASFKEKLNKLTENTTTIQSDFTQEKHLSFLSENIISKGKFAFKTPNLLRWEYAEPINYIIVFNDKKILISDDGKISSFDAQSNRIFSEINNMMVGTIQGSLFNDSERFNVKYFESEKQYLLELEPKMTEMKGMLKTIKIFIDKTDNSVASIKMIETSGDYTKIDFVNRKLNQSINGNLFDLK
ncbi:MAG: outer membrane lipoprotein carrier protein LolA [Bacteroidales bacterium]|jgi:outer membrane lipoprotein-sorting protein|nr:outer membrane lipoprotein carrier protein LolA [Bacteroidales bacterium]